MARNERKAIIEALEAELEMPVIAWVHGDRENVITQIGVDQIARFPRHIQAIGSCQAIGLLLYTRGGDTNVPWPVVNILRAYADELVVLVPFFAHSAGTLVCLGANRILMSKIATLSPIDPSVANAFNPQDPANPQNRIAIAVEDVMAYFELAKSQGVVRDEDLAAAFRRLADSVHPLALGNVHRSIEQIRQLAEKLIRLHSPDAEAEAVGERIRRLTTAFYTHSHLINRDEARSLGLPVEDPTEKVESLMLDYYGHLVDDLELRSKFDPAKIAAGAGQGQAPQSVKLERAYIETGSTADVYATEGVVSMQPQQVALPQIPQTPGQANPILPAIATLEITTEEWQKLE